MRKLVNMKPLERQKHILNLLTTIQKEWQVKELSARFNVSELTIRRDLEELAKSGDIIRTLGGCTAKGNGVLGTTFDNESARNLELKVAIASEATQLVKPGETILLGDGSTVLQLSANIGRMEGLTIYTNNIAAIQNIMNRGENRLFVLGGEYDVQFNMMRLQGSMTDRILESHIFDLIFIGTDALDEQGQCLSKNEEVARTNQIILRRGRRKILLADHTKTRSTGNVIYGNLSDFDLWITTQGLTEQQLAVYQKLTKLVQVEPNSLMQETLNFQHCEN